LVETLGFRHIGVVHDEYAVSPDGMETRSAVLYFRRDTTRQGDVGATSQPAHLGDPMGAKR